MPVVNIILVLACFLCTVLSVVGLIQIVRCREPATAAGLPPMRIGRHAPSPPRGRIRWGQVAVGLMAIATAVPLGMFAGFLAFWLSESYLLMVAVFASGVIAIVGTCSAMARDAGGVS
jgi:hypothetical protein